MDTLSQQPDDLIFLRSLPSLFLREGYVDAYCVYGAAPHTRFQAVANDLEVLPPALRMLVSLFFLGGRLPREEAGLVFADDEIAALVRLGLLMEDGEAGDHVHTGGLVLLSALGHLMFVPMPAWDPVVYFGDDSAALAIRLSPRRGARCLDLCAGPGIQALRASAAGGSVVAVEINPIAIACADLNIALNSLEDVIELRQGDLYGAVRPGETFDFVSANPPLLPFVPDLPYPFVGHGGADGLAVTRLILRGLPGALAPGGTAQLIGSCLGDAEGPHPRAELTAFAEEHGLRVMMTFSARKPLVPGATMFEGLSRSCSVAGGLDFDTVRERFRAHLETERADHLYLYFLTVSRAGRPEFVMTEHYRRPGGFWFR